MFEGVTLAERYRLDALVGHGSMGEVWRATDTTLGRTVAVKLLRLSGDDAGEANRMVREARIAGQLHHPNTVAVYDLQVANGRPFVVMEFVNGESLAHRIRREGRLSVEVTADLIGQVGRGLQAAHTAGIVHRDIKPANIMITSDGVAKLADFGIARGELDTALTQTGQMLGTITFMAPEIARGAVASAASDIWSLGATCFAAVDGTAPFGADLNANPTSVLIRLISEPAPAPVHAGRLTPVIAAMLAQDPADRPSLGEVLERLRGDLEATTVRTPPIISEVPVPPPAVTEPPVVTVPRPSPATDTAIAPKPDTEDDKTPRPPATPRRRRVSPIAYVAAAAVLVAGGVVGIIASSGGSKGHPNAAGSSSSTSNSPSTPAASTTTPAPSTTPTPTPTKITVDVSADPHSVIGSVPIASTADYYQGMVTSDGANLYALGLAVTGGVFRPVVVVDLDTNTTSEIPLSGTSDDLAMAPDKSVAYVSVNDAKGLAKIDVIDTNLGEITSTIPTPQRGTLKDLGNIGALAVSSDGKYLFETEPDSVAMISTATGSVLKYLTVHNGLGSLASSPDGSRIYVVSKYEHSVDVVQTSDGKRLATLHLAGFNNGVPLDAVVASPDGKYVYAYGENDGAGNESDTIGVITVASNTIRLVNVPSAIGGSYLAIAPSGRYLYMDGTSFLPSGDIAPSTLNILDTGTFSLRKVPLKNSPYGIAPAPDGRKLYVIQNATTAAVVG